MWFLGSKVNKGLIMKKILLLTPVLLLTGCFRSQIIAPQGKTIILASAADSCQKIGSRKVYSLFGLVNYNNNTTKSLLDNVPSGTKVRVKTKHSFWDILVSGLTEGLLSMHSIIVEGCK